MGHRGQFRLNRQDRKIMGVCSGLADHFAVDVTLVRVAMVVALVMTFPLMLFAYLAIGLIAKPGRGPRLDHGDYDAPRLSSETAEVTRARIQDLDQRMQAMETEITSANTALAREIDALR